MACSWACSEALFAVALLQIEGRRSKVEEGFLLQAYSGFQTSREARHRLPLRPYARRRSGLHLRNLL